MAETDIAGPSNAPSSENVTNDQEAEELKKELQRLVLEVIGGNQEDNDGIKVDHGVGNINKAIQALAALKKLNLERKKQQLSSVYDHLDVYRCPISKEMMRDPVILSTRQTYDRSSIYKWLKDVHQMCPRARDVTSHAVLIPNHLVREQIQQWCKAKNVQVLPSIEDHEEEVVVTISVEDSLKGTISVEDSLNGFLQRLSTLSDQKQAAKEIRLLTKSNHSIRPYFSESADAIPQLLNPLSILKNLYDHPDLQEDLVTIVLNISLHDGNKKIVCEYPLVIPLLVESLTCGTIDTRANAAAALSALSSLDSNKKLIGEKGDSKPLIHLLVEDGYHPSAMGDSEAVMVETEAEELKKELQRLVLEVIGGNQEDNDGNKVDHGVCNINKAIQALAALKELNLERKKRQLSSLYDHVDVPVEYRCPISKEMMRDPVILSTCQTYDRPPIYKWLKDVDQMCPHARDVISHAVLTPNHLVREQIQQWCKANNVQLLPPINEEVVVVTISDEDRLNGFLQRLSTLSDQKQAAKQIRLLTKLNHSIRPYFSESADAIPQLLNPLSLLKDLYDHPDLQEDLVTVLFNILLYDGNKKIVTEHPLVIPLLIESLTRGTIDTRANAAAALAVLSSLDSNKKLIGETGALMPLIGLLVEDHDHQSARRDSASAILELCGLAENISRLVSGGAVRVILQKMKNGAYIDRLLSVLAMLATHQDAIKELVELRAVEFLLGIISECMHECAADIGIVILVLMCEKNRAVLEEVGEEEKAHKTISKLAVEGSKKAKMKANTVRKWLFEAGIIRPC